MSRKGKRLLQRMKKKKTETVEIEIIQKGTVENELK
jgi:hypothetical protein